MLDEQALINHVQWSIEQANFCNSKLSGQVLTIPGYTGIKIRHLLNNICALEGNNNLQVGVWKGATFIAALYANQGNINQAVAFDNWSELGGPRQEFKSNCTRFLPYTSYQFYEQDFFATAIKDLVSVPIDIYFYDGEHTEEAHEKAFTHVHECFAPTFIALLDNWNWQVVKKGTRAAFEKLGYAIRFEQELGFGQVKNTQEWWHGFYVAVIRRHSI